MPHSFAMPHLRRQKNNAVCAQATLCGGHCRTHLKGHRDPANKIYEQTNKDETSEQEQTEETNEEKKLI